MPGDILETYANDENLNGYKKDGSQISVLIVDDSLAFRRLLKRILESAGYKVVAEVTDGSIAVSKYAELLPDVVTMDITMPEMEGDVAVDAIKRNHPEANIIMVTSLGHKELVQKCISKGAKGYILKPITDKQIPKILSTIKKAVLGG